MMNTTSNTPMAGIVSWPGLLVAMLLLVLISAAAGAGAAYWVLARYTLHMPLQSQALTVRLPKQLPVSVEILPSGQGGKEPQEGVEMHEFPIMINESFRTVVRVDTQVPIRMNVPFRGDVPVDITLPLDVRVKTRVLGINMELPVKGEIPLKFRLPVDLLIPIHQSLPMKFDLPVNTKINQRVSVKIPTQQAARITLQDPRLDVTLQDSEITVPLSWLSLVETASKDEETRLGPLVIPPSK